MKGRSCQQREYNRLNGSSDSLVDQTMKGETKTYHGTLKCEEPTCTVPSASAGLFLLCFDQAYSPHGLVKCAGRRLRLWLYCLLRFLLERVELELLSIATLGAGGTLWDMLVAFWNWLWTSRVSKQVERRLFSTYYSLTGLILPSLIA